MLISKKFIKGNILSFYEISKIIFSKRKPHVIFAVPQHFNRSENGNNPFIEKFIKCCDSNGIPYLKLESPEYDGPHPHNPTAVRIDLIFWMMMLLRKFFINIYFGNIRKTERAVAKTINIITFGKLKAPCYITMAGVFIEMFQEMCPDSTVYDLQHGIIYAKHPGYFDKNGNLSASLNAHNCKILVWGEKFRDLFINSCKDDNISERINVIGYPIEQIKKTEISTHKNIILFSLQFSPDISSDELMEYKAMLDEAVKEASNSGYFIKLKHHPRYNDVIDISDILEKYRNVEITTQSLDKLASKCLLHVTWYSTTVFEYASYGVPSYILSDEKHFLGKDIFYNQFRYPLFEGMSITDVIRTIKDSDKNERLGTLLNEWYEQIYTPFREDIAFSILN